MPQPPLMDKKICPSESSSRAVFFESLGWFGTRCARALLIQAAMRLTEPPHRDQLPDRPGLLDRATRQRRSVLLKAMTTKFAGHLDPGELDIHFTHMPARYWKQGTQKSVARHLELIHEFFLRLNSSDEAGTACIVRWKLLPKSGLTTVEVCTWDRLGLLAKIASAFAAVGINIVRADIFTRADHVALDVFQVAELAGNPVQNEARLRHMAALLAAALKPGGAVPARQAGPKTTGAVAVDFASSQGENYTMLAVEAPDRVGLLSDIFTTLADHHVNIAHAIITTENHRAGDVFYLTDDSGLEIPDGERRDRLRAAILANLS